MGLTVGQAHNYAKYSFEQIQAEVTALVCTALVCTNPVGLPRLIP